MNKLLNIMLNVSIIVLLVTLWGFYSAIRPFKIVSAITPKDYGVAYEAVSFKTKDHVLLKGWFIKSPNAQAKTIILMHGYPADKGNILPSTLFLYPTYNLLYFDFRFLGESEGHYSTLGKNEVLDLQAAIHYLHTRKIDEVGLWGFSLGGAVALMTAPIAPEIKAIVSDSSYARLDWMAYDYYRIPLLKYPLGELTRLWALLFLQYDIKHVSPASSAKNIQIPVLIIHSKQDNVVPFNNALLLQKSLQQNPNAKFMFTDRNLHGELLFNYDKVILEFYEKNLGL